MSSVGVFLISPPLLHFSSRLLPFSSFTGLQELPVEETECVFSGIRLPCFFFVCSHVGDLGNLVSDNQGKIDDEVEDNVVTLFGPYSVIGRAFVVRQDCFLLLLSLDFLRLINK